MGANLTRDGIVVVNFMFQLDWAMRYLIYPNIILGVFVRVFLDELGFESPDYIKQIVLPNMGGTHLIN